MSQDNIMVIVRLVLHIGGTIMTTLGWLSPADVGQVTELVLQIVGPITNLIALIWTALAQTASAKIASAAQLPQVTQITVTDPTTAAVVKAAAPQTEVKVEK